jgi:thioredoxin reductase (NADPH)
VAKPTILTVDDDLVVAQAITRDLRARYGADHRIVRTSSGAEALSVLEELARRDRPVALIVSDHRMPEMTGIEFLEISRGPAPDAKLVLLTAYADTDVAIKAINDIGLDHYLMKPWAPPEERLYPVIDDLLEAWHRANRGRFEGVRVVGHRWSQHAHETRNFLARNHVPYQWLDVERDPDAQRILDRVGAPEGEAVTLVLLPDGSPMTSPTIVELASALGLRTQPDSSLYDLVVVGAGPAGLAAAVYGASEGLSTVVVERESPGGQAGQSARIENYLGFPNGLSGLDLSHRAATQARRLGAEMVLARDVLALERRGSVHAVCLGDGTEIEARAVLIATGVSYRRIEAPGVDDFTGRGVYYGASATEARGTTGDEVYLVGAANSAGQAALNFAQFAKRVVMLVRAASLEASMSKYLIDRIMGAHNIDVRFEVEVVGAAGADHLESLVLRHRATAAEETVAANWLFAFIGASPLTTWLGDDLLRDGHGFVLTGAEAAGDAWPLTRPPFQLETSRPGVFAAGDVRQASMKRVASAVGEGAMAVSSIHRYLETI